MKKVLLALTATICLSGCVAMMLTADLRQQHLEYWTPLLENPETDGIGLSSKASLIT